MPAESIRVDSLTSHAVHQRRRSERRNCDLEVVVRANGGDLPARLIDVSAGGLGLRIGSLVALRPGTRLIIAHHLLGEIACVLRWSMHPRYGAEFRAGRHALARVEAFYDALPRAPKQF